MINLIDIIFSTLLIHISFDMILEAAKVNWYAYISNTIHIFMYSDV